MGGLKIKRVWPMKGVCQVLGLLSIFAAAALSPSWAGLSALAGSWRLDQKESDNLRRVVAESLEYNDWSQLHQVQTPRGPRLFGKVRQEPSDKEVNQALGFLDSLVPTRPLVQIEHRDPQVILKYENGLERRVDLKPPGPGENTQSTAASGDQKLVLAAWEEGALVIETNTLSGARVLERLELDGPQSNRLKVSIEVNVARLPNPVMFERYYLPAS